MDKLGIQWSAIAIQVINFGLLVFLLQKLLYKPLLKKLDERTKRIADSLKLEETLKVRSDSLDSHEVEVLKKAKKTANEYLVQARKEAISERELLLKQAKSENDKLLARIVAQQEAQFSSLKQELAKSTVDIASEMTKSILSDVLSESDQHKILTASLKKLKSLK